MTVSVQVNAPVGGGNGLYIPGYDGNPDVGLTNPGALSSWGGSYTFTSTQTVEDKEFDSNNPVKINSGVTVTFINCLFSQEGQFYHIDEGDSGVGTVVMEDCEIGAQGAGDPCENGIGYVPGTFKRVLIHSVEDAIKGVGDSLYEMIQTKEFDNFPNHHDAIQALGPSSDSVCSYCNFDGEITDVQAVLLKTDSGDISDWTFDNCYFNGGGWQFQLVNESPYNVTGTVVTNCIFGPTYSVGYAATDPGTYSTWTNNVDWQDNPVSP
jgi:hypothetical protein